MEREIVDELETVVVERSGPALIARINRPKQMNALWTQVYLDLHVALDRAERDESVKAVVLTGTGDRAFCAGGDKNLDLENLAGQGPEQNIADARLAQAFIRRLHELPLPVIARVNGVAVGGGLDLALACDLIVAADHARFGSVWIKRGLTPALGGAWFLVRRVGVHRAKELVLTGDIIDAAEAARIGLVNQVVPLESLDAAVDALVEKLAAASPLALELNKALVDRAAEHDLGTYFDVAAAGGYALSKTEEHLAGVRTLLEGKQDGRR